MNAGVGYQNLVTVSSIPPNEEIYPKIDNEKGITFVPLNKGFRQLPFSSIIHVVKSMNNGKRGDTISCSIALAKIKTNIEGQSKECVLAFEAQDSIQSKAEESALVGVKKMVTLRNGLIQESWENSGYKLISSSLKIEKKFGCVVAFVVFDPFTYEKI
jgi:pyruvoyl-dependent arginine decarboxylase (PvlArgDC)